MRYVLVHNIPSPYRLPLYGEMNRQLKSRGLSFEVHFMARGHKERPKSWLNPAIDAPHKYWRDWGFGQHHFNPGLIWHLLRNPPEWLDLGSPYDTFTCIFLALFCRARHKVMVLEGNTKTPGRMKGAIGWFKRLILSRATYLPVPGIDARRFIDMHRAMTRRRLGPCPFRPNIIDQSKFHPREFWPEETINVVRNDLGVGKDERLCIIPARLVEVKGLVPFVQALDVESLHGWKVVIVGEGPLRNDILKLIDERGLTGYVLIRRYVPYDDMPRFYAASDLMLLPSVQDMNPLSVVEAVFSGLPIALSDQVGNVEEGVSEGRNGWVLPVKDAEGYRAKLKKIFSTPLERLQEMGKRSYLENARFWDAHAAINGFLNGMGL